MTDDPITIEPLKLADRVCVDEPVPLQLVIRCPENGKPTVLRAIRPLKPAIAELDADLFERDLPIQPGEVYRCTVIAKFRTTGFFRDPLFVVNAGQDTYARAVRVPTPAIRVVPSLFNELRPRLEAICTYDHGTKVDVTLSHVGQTKFEDFRLMVGPTEAVQAGVSAQRRPAFNPGEQLKFTTVIAADTIELALNATAGGEQIGLVSRKESVPPVRDTATAPLFRFLEPKKLTQADVRVYTLDEVSELVQSKSGVHDVYGGGTKYRVEIKPAHPHASKVLLRSLSGSVEVTEMPADPGTWAFQMVVVKNVVFTSPAALHYDVITPEVPQQGELNLAVRPASAKLWAVAATAGFALTAKGRSASLRRCFLQETRGLRSVKPSPNRPPSGNCCNSGPSRSSVPPCGSRIGSCVGSRTGSRL